ncbi:MAG: NUMOD4 domain-containing protein [Bacteroidia bacterium]
MIKYLKGEIWKPVRNLEKYNFNKHYAVSNLGRFASYENDLQKDGTLLNGSVLEGYRVFRMRIKNKSKTFMLHHFVAECFCERKSNVHSKVIHLNYNKADNKASNLQLVTYKQMLVHHRENPAVLAVRSRKTFGETKGHKLTAKKVIQIKKQLNNPNRKLKLKDIAANFNISEMQLYRIKRGENWAHVNP